MYTLEFLIDPQAQANLELVWWLLSLGAALLVFINIQIYYANPRRREMERDWAQAFETAQLQRYADSDIEWRAKDLHLHFGHQLTGRDTLDEWYGSKMSIF